MKDSLRIEGASNCAISLSVRSEASMDSQLGLAKFLPTSCLWYPRLLRLFRHLNEHSIAPQLSIHHLRRNRWNYFLSTHPNIRPNKIRNSTQSSRNETGFWRWGLFVVNNLLQLKAMFQISVLWEYRSHYQIPTLYCCNSKVLFCRGLYFSLSK